MSSILNIAVLAARPAPREGGFTVNRFGRLRFLSGRAVALATLVAATSLFLTIVTPASALAPHLSPLQAAQQREDMTSGGVFDPNVVPPFTRFDASGQQEPGAPQLDSLGNDSDGRSSPYGSLRQRS
jgi:hypothetical protein